VGRKIALQQVDPVIKIVRNRELFPLGKVGENRLKGTRGFP
jgi:hypothetical protein